MGTMNITCLVFVLSSTKGEHELGDESPVSQTGEHQGSRVQKIQSSFDTIGIHVSRI